MTDADRKTDAAAEEMLPEEAAMVAQMEKALDASAAAATSAATSSPPPAAADDAACMMVAMRRRPSVAQLILAANTVVLLVLALTNLGIFPKRSVSPEPSLAFAPPAEALRAPVAASTSAPAKASDRGAEPPAPPAMVGTWKEAEAAHAAGDYPGAIKIYRALIDVSQAQIPDAVTSEILRLRLAQCAERSGAVAQAKDQFALLLNSCYPTIRVLANYHLAQLLGEQGLPQQARMRAYTALAHLPLLARPTALESDCDYLLARWLTQESLACFDNAPEICWPSGASAEPGLGKTDLLAGLNETQLRKAVEEGAACLSSSVLGAKIQRSSAAGSAATWSIECSNASLEDVLGRFSQACETPVEWSEVPPAARGRTISVFCHDASAQRVMEIACGQVGLVARFTGDKVIVFDPQSTLTAAQRRELLHKESVSAWWRFALRHADDRRNAQAHGALGALLECAGDFNGAIGEYQFVAKTYNRESDAARALLACVRLKIRMHDFVGAQQDLVTLLDGYPDCPNLDEVYGGLAQAKLAQGQVDDALAAFHKLYFLNLSEASKAQACLGLGKCHYLKADHNEACLWLHRYITLAQTRPGLDMIECYLLLAKAEDARGRSNEAVKAYSLALQAEPSKAQRHEALFDLAKVQARQGNYVGAVGSAFSIDPAELDTQQGRDLLLLKSRIFREMDLPERAVSALQSGLSGLNDPEIIATIRLEIARCQIQMGRDEEAFGVLNEILPRLPSGETSHAAFCDMAEACLRLDRPEQAIVVLTELGKVPTTAAIRQRASAALAKAYLSRQDFERAAMALADSDNTKAGGKP